MALFKFKQNNEKGGGKLVNTLINEIFFKDHGYDEMKFPNLK